MKKHKRKLKKWVKILITLLLILIAITIFSKIGEKQKYSRQKYLEFLNYCEVQGIRVSEENYINYFKGGI